MSNDPDTSWSPENHQYWQASRDGKLIFKRCLSCSKPHYYPRRHCPICGHGETEWAEASGLGTLYSFTIVRRADPPYVVAYVTLDEGVTMLTNIVDCAIDELQIGQKMRVVFRAVADERIAPMFTPAIGILGSESERMRP